MQVVAFNGSPRNDGNTFHLINTVFAELQKEGIQTELVQIGGKPLRGCIACYKCFENKNQRCAQTKDMLNDCIEKIIAADGVILGSPTYFANLTSELAALIARAGLVAKANNEIYRHKVGAAVVAARRAGSVFTFDAINHFFTISQMIVPGASYWNLAIGLQKGDVEKDDEGMRTMRTLGQNMAFLLKKLKA